MSTAKGLQHALHDLTSMHHHHGKVLLLMKRHSGAAEPSCRPNLSSPSACVPPTAAEESKLTALKPVCREGLLLLLAQAIAHTSSACSQTTVAEQQD